MGICSRINQSVNKRDNKESECFIADVCVVFCAFLLFLSHSVAFHFVGHIQGVFLTCLKTTLHQDSDIPMVIHHERLGEKIGKDHFGLWYLCL